MRGIRPVNSANKSPEMAPRRMLPMPAALHGIIKNLWGGSVIELSGI
jgi:hypothetical protein